MDPTIAHINPFPLDVRTAFQTYIHSFSYVNRERLDYLKYQQLLLYLQNPQLKPVTQAESRLKHRAQTEFMLLYDKLYRKPDARFQSPRSVVLENKAFDTIVNEHLQLLHAGRTKIWTILQQKYYRLKREEAEFILKRCKNCTLNCPATIKAPLVLIISGQAWERV